MIKKFRMLLWMITALAAVMLFGCSSGNKEGGNAGGPSPAVPAADRNVSAAILGMTTASPQVVTFTLTDPDGAALDPAAFIAAGGSIRFTIAQIDPATGYYRNYIAASTPGQPGFDSGGTFATTGPGTYTYTFKTNIRDAAKTLGGLVFDAARTHTVAAQIQRTISSAADGSATFQQAANPYFNFRPDGGAVTVTREVVSISACNECHGKLGLHGGGRRDIALCILCHNPGIIDPVTGNSIDMKSLIHKIHMGAQLPSNQTDMNGRSGDFTIIGFGSSVNSYKSVAYPFLSGDTFRWTTFNAATPSKSPFNCTKCHRAGTDLMGNAYGKDVDKWKGPLKIANCTTCHDLTTFDGSTTVTVMNQRTPVTMVAQQHTGGPQTDAGCGNCHDGAFNNANGTEPSVEAAHTVIEKSPLFLKGNTEDINFQIVSVDPATAVPGQKPVVTFKVTDMNGGVVSMTANSASFNLKLGYMEGINYTNNFMGNFGQPLSQSLKTAVLQPDNTYKITFESAIPDQAKGTGVIGLEGRRTYSYQAIKHDINAWDNPPALHTVTARIGGRAAQYYFNLATGAQVADPSLQRRKVVDADRCNKCHDRLSLHGSNRVNNAQECVICHNPDATDRGSSSRQVTPLPADGLAEQAIDFKVMIHKIHTGENLLVKPYMVSGGIFSDVRYPRDRKDCEACHIAGTYGLPLLPGLLGTSISTGPWMTNNDSKNTRLAPMQSVCTSCHDDHASHANTFTDAKLGEQCLSCHATGIARTSWNIAHRPAR